MAIGFIEIWNKYHNETITRIWISWNYCECRIDCHCSVKEEVLSSTMFQGIHDIVYLNFLNSFLAKMSKKMHEFVLLM